MDVMGILGPLIQQLGFGGICGFCVGYFAKKVAKVTAFLIGGMFVLLQILIYYNIASVNWGAMGDAFEAGAKSGALDSAVGSLMKVLLHNLPFGAAFTGGLVLGLKRG